HRNREAVARVEPGLTGDRGVDPDHLAAHAYERTARVAGIDRCVGLNEVLDAALTAARQTIQGAALGAHDAGSDREGESFAERVSNGEYPFADPGVIAVAERDRRQVLRVDLEDGDIRVGIGSYNLGLELSAVEQADCDLLGTFDDVVVREDVAIC